VEESSGWSLLDVLFRCDDGVVGCGCALSSALRVRRTRLGCILWKRQGTLGFVFVSLNATIIS